VTCCDDFVGPGGSVQRYGEDVSSTIKIIGLSADRECAGPAATIIGGQQLSCRIVGGVGWGQMSAFRPLLPVRSFV